MIIAYLFFFQPLSGSINRVLEGQDIDDKKKKQINDHRNMMNDNHKLKNQFYSTMKITIFAVVCLYALLFNGSSTILDDIVSLNESLAKEYWSENSTFKFMETWDHLEGLYASYIHFNIVDKKNGARAYVQRQRFKIDDENMFVTSFVLYGLLEAKQLGTIEPDPHRFSRSLQTLASFADKNQPFGVPQYTFWPQKQINASWSASSVNLFALIDLIPNLPTKLQTYLANHGLGIWTYAKEMKSQFCIPADVDDSSVNIALLGYLQELGSSSYHFWQKFNFGLRQFYDRVLKYAYRPFTPTNFRSDEIDPRTYFIIHNFLREKKQKAESEGQRPKLILPTTWMLNRQQTIIDVVRMPFDLNNIDASVNANFLFGLLFQIRYGFEPNAELRQMMRDIADLLVYVIEDAIHRRPDLILMYYPSKYDFYWFVGRTLGLLQRMNSQDEDIKYVFDRLSQVMRGAGTNQILAEKNEGKNGWYWVEFLGNFGKKNRTQDSIYSTAMVLNALLDAWGLKAQKSFQYLPDTPATVKEAVAKGVTFLSANIKAKRVKLNNAFFSGSLKILMKDYPTIFPGNKIVDKNSIPIDAQKATFNDMANILQDCVKGYIQDNQYQKMLKMKWFQADVPITFEGYNDGNGVLFPFWSAPAITQVMMITALSKYYRATQ